MVYGREVNQSTCASLHSYPSILEDEKATFNLLNYVSQLRVCPGQPDKHFVELLQKRKGCIKTQDGLTVASIDDRSCVALNGEKFSQTVRVAKCDLLTNLTRCNSCKNYRPTLRALYNRHMKEVASPKRSEKSTH